MQKQSVSCIQPATHLLRCGTFEKGTHLAMMGCRKLVGLVAIIVLFHLPAAMAEPEGFLSIDCGGQTNYTGQNNITWVTDANYIDVGVVKDIGNATQQTYLTYLHSRRVFPKPLNKSCYHLPLVPNVPHLLRLWFGSYSGFQNFSSFNFSFSIETFGMLAVRNITITKNSTNPFNHEAVLVSSGRLLYICLIRTSETDDPFISAIESRRLQDGMYRQAKPGKILSLLSRHDLGGKSWVRYPLDAFDRLWAPDSVDNLLAVREGISTATELTEHILTNNTQDFPPTVVMQTAWEANPNVNFLTFSFNGILESTESLLLLYFAEVTPPHPGENISFNLSINGFLRNEVLLQNYSAKEVPVQLGDTPIEFELVQNLPTRYSTPLLNAFEIYSIFDAGRATSSQDVKALDTIKSRYNITSWISDPCYVMEWDGIRCDRSGSSIRISEIDLSGKNLSGPVPLNISQLTALVNVSLENNHLTGELPNFSGLTSLERLYLQNNNLSGRIPDWLSGLQNLRELFIDNNNFSGVIPAELLSRHSLKFTYSGNLYLDFSSPSNKDSLHILKITLSGSLIIVLVLTVGIIIYRKKSGRNERSRPEKESKHVTDQDKSIIIMPNATKSRAFTLQEMMASTQNFCQKIGEGGFGSVFFGKLEDGKDIAVKVLSLFSKQGVQEFLNEVDLLSRVNHKNLVPLLGYCIESRELMLVYEHMSEGSLKDHLYGPRAKLSRLKWETRLKIASDAAQGLEYLHVGCTPKIIHRDIKTANILLDTNSNGKLSDFGLSKVKIDGEVSHVTTAVKGTVGYLDPEYFSTQMLTEKSDVYSFGVVLLEIICGRQPINSKLPGERLNLIRWVKPYVEMDENPSKLAEIIDKRLDKNYDIKSIAVVAKLAIQCVQREPSSRPSVSEVVAKLKEAIKLEKDKGSLISEIDIDYGDLCASPGSSSVNSSGIKEMDSAEGSSKLPTIPQEG